MNIYKRLLLGRFFLSFLFLLISSVYAKEPVLQLLPPEEVLLGEAMVVETSNSASSADTLFVAQAAPVIQSVPANNTGGWSIDTNDRQLVSAVGWGEVRTPTNRVRYQCWGSAVTPTYKNEIIRINMLYRRATIKGATYFFTLNLAERNKTLLIDEIDKLRLAINKVKKQHPFRLDAMVVLPDHLHAMITLPEGDNDYAKRWSLIKAGFSRQLPKNEKITISRLKKGERGIWQRRYWEHCIRNEEDYENHVDYIHYNHVKHGYVEQANEWSYSTIHHYISAGLLNPQWGCGVNDFDGKFGET